MMNSFQATLCREMDNEDNTPENLCCQPIAPAEQPLIDLENSYPQA